MLLLHVSCLRRLSALLLKCQKFPGRCLLVVFPQVLRKVTNSFNFANLFIGIVEKVFGKFGAVVVDWPRSSNPDEKGIAIQLYDYL